MEVELKGKLRWIGADKHAERQTDSDRLTETKGRVTVFKKH